MTINDRCACSLAQWQGWLELWLFFSMGFYFILLFALYGLRSILFNSSKPLNLDTTDENSFFDLSIEIAGSWLTFRLLFYQQKLVLSKFSRKNQFQLNLHNPWNRWIKRERTKTVFRLKRPNRWNRNLSLNNGIQRFI